MSERPPRHVLLCLAGKTPQIITEVLYAVTQKLGERVDEVRVITTVPGKQRILAELLDPERGQFAAFCRDYGLDRGSVRFDETTIHLLRAAGGGFLEDIRTEEDNRSAADDICEVVRELTGDAGTRLHASAAGGRKTMGVYLTAAMQLFGRPDDALTHVLVSEEFETHPEFFYKPPAARLLKTRDGREVSTDVAEIYLADIPFIRLRGLGTTWPGEVGLSYGDLVHKAQQDLKLAESAQELRLDVLGHTVTVADRRVQLSAREFFFYLLFAHLRRRGHGPGGDGFLALDEIGRDDLDEVFRLVTAAANRERGVEDYELVAGYDFIGDLLAWVELPYTAAEFRETFLQVKAKINRRFKSAALRDRYVIATAGRRGSSRYGIRFAPEHMVIS